jgi:hypothetical protein
MATNEELVVKVNELLDELAADKKKAKEKEAAESWTKSAAISIVVIAVLGAVAAQRSGSYGTRSLKHLNKAIYHQVSASNQWAYYQAKSTKANLYSAIVEQTHFAEGADVARSKAENDPRVKKYKAEQEEIMNEAKGLEKKRDDENAAADANGGTGAGLGTATLLFQVAVAIISICVVSKRKMLWYAALTLGAVALGLAIMQFLGAPPV